MLEAIEESNAAIAATCQRPAVDREQRTAHLASLRWWRDREVQQLNAMLRKQQ